MAFSQNRWTVPCYDPSGLPVLARCGARNHSESIEDHPAGIAKFPLPVIQAAQPCESGMDGTVELPIDRAIQDTCSVVYPPHGLDQGTEPERDRPQPPHSGAGRATASGSAERIRLLTSTISGSCRRAVAAVGHLYMAPPRALTCPGVPHGVDHVLGTAIGAEPAPKVTATGTVRRTRAMSGRRSR